MLSISKLRTEYLENPIGIDAANPRLSWILKSSRQNVMQDSYRVLASSDPGFSDILWDSGIVESQDSVRVRYQGKPLNTAQKSRRPEEATLQTMWILAGQTVTGIRWLKPVKPAGRKTTSEYGQT